MPIDDVTTAINCDTAGWLQADPRFEDIIFAHTWLTYLLKWDDRWHDKIILRKGNTESKWGVTTSRATSGGWRKDRNTSGQRVNKFNNSYSHISVIVTVNNSLLKPKCQQYTSLNKMLSNFSKVLMAHISFTAVINNGGIGKGIGGIWKDTKKNYIYVL